MTVVQAIATVVLAWIALIIVVRAIVRLFLSQGPGDAFNNLLWRFVQLFCRVVHRVRFCGLDCVPQTRDPGPLIVVANHTGAIDPLLLQAACRFEIRWMMAEEMMGPSLDWLWKRARTIAVDRHKADSAPLREAIRHVKAGGVIGIFPEGRIVSPRGEVRPFMEGVGLIVSRTKAPVLLAWISGTAEKMTMSGSLLTPSNARVQFIERADFSGQKDPAAITQELRRRIADAAGWRINDEPMAPLRPAPALFST